MIVRSKYSHRERFSVHETLPDDFTDEKEIDGSDCCDTYLVLFFSYLNPANPKVQSKVAQSHLIATESVA